MRGNCELSDAIFFLRLLVMTNPLLSLCHWQSRTVNKAEMEKRCGSVWLF